MLRFLSPSGKKFPVNDPFWHPALPLVHFDPVVTVGGARLFELPSTLPAAWTAFFWTALDASAAFSLAWTFLLVCGRGVRPGRRRVRRGAAAALPPPPWTVITSAPRRRISAPGSSGMPDQEAEPDRQQQYPDPGHKRGAG